MFCKGLVSSFPRNIKTKTFYCMQTCNISAFSLQLKGTGFLLCIHLVCLSIFLSFSLYHLVKRVTDYWKQLQSLLKLGGLSYQFVRCRTTPEDGSCPNLLERDWRHSGQGLGNTQWRNWKLLCWEITLCQVAWPLFSAAFQVDHAPVPMGQQAQRRMSEYKASSCSW